MVQKKEIVFIVNPRSGTHGKNEIPRIIGESIDKGAFNSQVIFTEYAGHAAEIASRCVAEKTDIAVAVGGDGTVNEVARSLVHSAVRFGQRPGPPPEHTHGHKESHCDNKQVQHRGA